MVKICFAAHPFRKGLRHSSDISKWMIFPVVMVYFQLHPLPRPVTTNVLCSSGATLFKYSQIKCGKIGTKQLENKRRNYVYVSVGYQVLLSIHFSDSCVFAICEVQWDFWTFGEKFLEIKKKNLNIYLFMHTVMGLVLTSTVTTWSYQPLRHCVTTSHREQVFPQSNLTNLWFGMGFFFIIFFIIIIFNQIDFCWYESS